MTWVWDPHKDAANQAKHGVSFEFAVEVFKDPFHLSAPDLHPDGDRWTTIGRVGPVTLFVVHTLLEPETDSGRVISARRATRHERKAYEEGDS